MEEIRKKLDDILDAESKKKSFVEWFHQLPEPYCSQAISNWEKDYIQGNLPIASSLSNALIFGFCWDNTPEGSEYWIRVMNEYCKK